MTRRSIQIVYLQETKLVGEKSREFNHIGYKLYYRGRD